MICFEILDSTGKQIINMYSLALQVVMVTDPVLVAEALRHKSLDKALPVQEFTCGIDEVTSMSPRITLKFPAARSMLCCLLHMYSLQASLNRMALLISQRIDISRAAKEQKYARCKARLFSCVVVRSSPDRMLTRPS